MRRILSSFSPPVYPPPNTHKSNSSVILTRNIVIVLGVVLFICVLLHFLLRYLMKKKTSSNSNSNSNHQETENEVVSDERQLQQLFSLHDSGLDQAFIDALPLFHYKELMGLKEPFDCAVCLCEFSQNDKLRLVPLCSHAFHIHCIDTWLLSNSTCPLCRGTLFSPHFSVQNPIFDFHDSVQEDDDYRDEKRVFPVRLGKFKATNDEKKEVGETSNSNVDARRCFSMGSYDYVVGNSELQVTFCPSNKGNVGRKDLGLEKDNNDGKKIASTSKGESFSISKIWLWSKKDQYKFQDSLFNVSLPSTNTHNATNFHQ